MRASHPVNDPIYISDGGDARGPYTQEQLRLMWSAGLITAAKLYWNATKEEWRNICELNLPKELTNRPNATNQTAANKVVSDAGKSESNYHKPYCRNCRKHVMPQVVGTSRPVGGFAVSSESTPLAVARVVSQEKFRKFCPICGEEVFSQATLDAQIARSNAEAKEKKRRNKSALLLLACVWVTGVTIATLGYVWGPLLIAVSVGAFWWWRGRRNPRV